jgi:hypothetical protein
MARQPSSLPPRFGRYFYHADRGKEKEEAGKGDKQLF